MPSQPARRSRRLLQLVRAAVRILCNARDRPAGSGHIVPDLSPGLRAFVAELPEERESVLTFVVAAAGELPAGARVLDAGAGNAPYRELFGHCEYVTADWENSPHEHAAAADLAGSLHDLPLADESFDAILCTQVLEHVAEPLAVLSELCRVVRPGGRLFLTVPLAWQLHEEPFDFFRYTPHGLHHLVTGAGFQVESIRPRNGYFTTLAGLARTSIWAIWDTDDPDAPERVLADRLMRLLTRLLPAFDALDERRLLPLGYACVALRPPA